MITDHKDMARDAPPCIFPSCGTPRTRDRFFKRCVRCNKMIVYVRVYTVGFEKKDEIIRVTDMWESCISCAEKDPTMTSPVRIARNPVGKVIHWLFRRLPG